VKLQWTESSVKQAIEGSLVKVYKAIRAAFDMKDRERPQLLLMIGARLDDWEAMLVRTADTAVTPVTDLDFVGAGDELPDC
jgi:hypothetical protein